MRLAAAPSFCSSSIATSVSFGFSTRTRTMNVWVNEMPLYGRVHGPGLAMNSVPSGAFATSRPNSSAALPALVNVSSGVAKYNRTGPSFGCFTVGGPGGVLP